MKSSSHRFRDKGPFENREFLRSLEFCGEHFIAHRLPAIQSDGTAGVPAYVLSGRRILELLPEYRANSLRSFTESIKRLNPENEKSKGETAKSYVKQHFEGNHARRGVRIMPYFNGPYPALEIGRVNSVPVLATPLALEGRSGSETNELTADIDRDVRWEQIIKFFPVCASVYVSQCLDIFRSFLLRKNRARVIKFSKEIENILEWSLNEKVRILQRKRSDISPRLSAMANQYAAVSANLSVLVEMLREISGVPADVESKLNVLRSRFNKLERSDPLFPQLEECFEVVFHPDAERSHISPVGEIARSGTASHTEWLSGLLFTCDFVARIYALHTNDSRINPIRVFVTHHMGVYASEQFYLQFCEACKELDQTVLVWTGTGRVDSISLSIWPKLWLSDVQALYVPNSLDTRDGVPKALGPSEDWVIEEILYGYRLRLQFHIVKATGKSSDGHEYFERILNQVQDYDWDSLPEPIGDSASGAIDGNEIHRRLKDHDRNRIWSAVRPSYKALSGSGFKMLQKGILGPALQFKITTLVSNIRADIGEELWRSVQAVAEGVTPLVSRTSFVAKVTLSEAEKEYRKRWGKFKGDREIRYQLRRELAELSRYRTRFLGETIRIIDELGSEGADPVFYFGLGKMVSQAFSALGGLEIDKKKIASAFWQEVKKGI